MNPWLVGWFDGRTTRYSTSTKIDNSKSLSVPLGLTRIPVPRSRLRVLRAAISSGPTRLFALALQQRTLADESLFCEMSILALNLLSYSNDRLGHSSRPLPDSLGWRDEFPIDVRR